MFDNVLLDSSASRASVLRRDHYLLSAAAGGTVALTASYLLRLIAASGQTKGLMIEAALLGAVAIGYSLMLCYVYADARRSGLSAKVWLVVTFLLSLVGFLIYLIYSAAKSGEWKRAAVPMAYIAQVLLVGVMVLIPLIYTQALPKMLLSGGVPIAPPPPAPRGVLTRRSPPRRASVDLMHAPIVIPHGIRQITEKPEELGPVAEAPGFGVPGGVADGVPNAVPWSAPWGTSPPPPPQPKPEIAKPRMVRLGGQVVAAKLIHQVTPEYPPLARMARVQGIVRLEAIIGKDGSVQDLRVISGHPLLVRAALEAVEHWRYQPTLLNGEPVEVLTEIEVTFKLAD